MALEYINPEGMHQNPVFSQGIVVPSGARILHVGGQNAVDAEGVIVGKGDIGKQTEQALANMLMVIDAAGGKLENLIKVTLVIQQGIDIRPGFAEWLKVWGPRLNPPTVTALMVVGLANPDYLIEIEAQVLLS
ncbi:MAG: RidA family protein [Pelagibacterium sp.]|jgi:enamine deaminase RidA (YjgF/YER057c/UK114 family)|uniref:RidA family protein n=1 Tax=Pelagibacterium sp. TaxID=1967288 RepID=UPI0032EE0F49|tara:strand:+ start:6521 stop:6919 length:399 start_codon:yes stop_codon:yes gene_type:complete